MSLIQTQNVFGCVLTGDGVLDECDVSKVSGVGDAETAHAVSVSPLLQEGVKYHYQWVKINKFQHI